MKKISIFGLGYVGCVSIGCLAQEGHYVIGVDLVDLKVNMINSGKPTIIEKDVDKLIYEQWKKGRISATKDYIRAVKNTEVSIICVGTPSSNEGHLNLKYVYKTAKQIAEGLREKKGFHVIVIRSTVVPGTNRRVGEIVEKISRKKRNAHFAVVSNPEFMREGTSIEDYYNPQNIILASENDKAIQIMKNIYSEINAAIEETEIEVAEFIKYVNNSFHALKVSFANEIGNICKKLNIDSHKVLDLFCKDFKLNLSPYYLKPGFAYGGSCLPKDLRAIQTLARDLCLSSPLLEAIEKSNENQKKLVFNMIMNKRKKKIGILGLTFKVGSDDMRNSPMVGVVGMLIEKGCEVLLYDENVVLSKLLGENKRYIDQNIPQLSSILSDDLNYVINNSKLLVISQNEEEFRNIEKKYPTKIIIDLVRITEKKSNKNYEGVCW